MKFHYLPIGGALDKYQNELKHLKHYERKRLNSKTRKKSFSFSQSAKIRESQGGDDILKGTRRKVLKKHSTTTMPMEIDQSHRTIANLFGKRGSVKKDEGDNDNRNIASLTLPVQRVSDPVVSSLATRIGSLFQRRGNSKATDTKQPVLNYSVRGNSMYSRDTDFEKVRNELKQFQKRASFSSCSSSEQKK
jgi:hypothetical protein